MGTSISLPPELVPSSGLIAVTPCSVKVTFTIFVCHQIKTQFVQLRCLWGSLSIKVLFTPRLVFLLALALVLAFSLTLPRPVLARVLVLSLALAGSVVSLLLFLGRCLFALI